MIQRSSMREGSASHDTGETNPRRGSSLSSVGQNNLGPTKENRTPEIQA